MFTLDKVVPWGRSFDEYQQLFALTPADLERRILGCGDGPAAFNAEATRRGARVVSCDPLVCLQPRRHRGADRRDLRHRAGADPPPRRPVRLGSRHRVDRRAGRGPHAGDARLPRGLRRGQGGGPLRRRQPARPAVRGWQLRPRALLAPAVPLQRAVRRGVPPRVDPRDVPRRRRSPHLPAARAGRLALAVRRGLRRGSARGRRGGRDGARALRVPARRERDAATCAGAQRPLERAQRRVRRPPPVPPEFAAAYAHCERIAREHYENFPVASRLLPAAMRPHVAAVYAFARAADDFADEGDAGAGRALSPARRLEGAAARAGRRRRRAAIRPTASSPPSPRPGACASSTSSCSTIC